MLSRLLDRTRVTCGMCGTRFLPGLGYGPFGTSACSSRCRHLQLCALTLPRYALFVPTGPDRRSVGTVWQ